MDIEITQIINEYPQWVSDYTSAPPIRIPESVPVNYEVGRFRATSTVPDASLNYFIARGDTPQQNGSPISFYSRLDERTNEMVLLTYRILDYETLSRYTLTIKAAVSVTVIHSFIRLLNQSTRNHKIIQDAQLSQRDRAAGCVTVFAKSRRLELGDNILRTL